jgi:hypothetical protein
MFKGFFMRKTVAMICVFALLASYPISLSANVGNTAAFTFFGMNSTTVTAGNPITFTIRTSGANFVFADIGGHMVAGVMLTNPDHAGHINWSLTINPMASETILVYANSINAVEGAAVISVPITVNPVAVEPLPEQIPQMPVVNVHRIYGITEVEATQPQSVSLRIVTDAEAGSVWVVPEPGRYLQASRAAGEPGVWEINYRPRTFAPHQIQVNANHIYILDASLATENFSVHLAAPYVVTVSPSINRVTAPLTTISRGDRLTISVRTNNDVEHVWMEVDGRRVNARRAGGTATNRNWDAEVRPDSTQTIRVYANTTNDPQGASSDTIRITVREQEDARITGSPTIDRNWLSYGERTTIHVRTNEDARYVWAVVNGSRVNGRREGTTGNDRNWTIDVRPDNSQTIRIYASSTNHERDADTRSISITVN